MAKHWIDLTDEDLEAARAALGTSSVDATVTEALRLAVVQAARRREIDRGVPRSGGVS